MFNSTSVEKPYECRHSNHVCITNINFHANINNKYRYIPAVLKRCPHPMIYDFPYILLSRFVHTSIFIVSEMVYDFQYLVSHNQPLLVMIMSSVKFEVEYYMISMWITLVGFVQGQILVGFVQARGMIIIPAVPYIFSSQIVNEFHYSKYNSETTKLTTAVFHLLLKRWSHYP